MQRKVIHLIGSIAVAVAVVTAFASSPAAKDEKSGKRTQFYYCCETGETGDPVRVARDTAISRSCETGEVGIAAKNPTSPTSQACESAGKPADRPSSPLSPSSRPAMETPVDQVEVEI